MGLSDLKKLKRPEASKDLDDPKLDALLKKLDKSLEGIAGPVNELGVAINAAMATVMEAQDMARKKLKDKNTDSKQKTAYEKLDKSLSDLSSQFGRVM